MKNLRISKTGYWQLRLVIPADVRDVLGKREFKKSLGQLTKQEAEIEANLLLSKWKFEILRCRQQLKNITGTETNPVNLQHLSFDDDHKKRITRQAVSSLELLAGVPEVSNQDVAHHIRERLEDDFDISATEDDVGAYFGIYCKPASYLEQYRLEKLSGLVNKRSEDEHLGVLRNQFIANFPIIDDRFTKRMVEQWWDSFRVCEKPPAPSTLRKYKSHCSAYMRWLRRKEYTLRPNFFDELEPITKREASKKRVIPKRKAFTDTEIGILWSAMISAKKPDKPLQELFLLALYTGCRIEELCQLQECDVKQTETGRLYIDIPVSKTERGEERLVPVHKAIEPIVTSKTGYLVEVGIVNNRYGERSSAIGKRFSRLKSKLNFGADKVFHSTRKTFIDKLKEHGTPEQFAADIVGHEIHTMTYGVYASGAPISTLFQYVDQISYKSLEQQTNDSV